MAFTDLVTSATQSGTYQSLFYWLGVTSILGFLSVNAVVFLAVRRVRRAKLGAWSNTTAYRARQYWIWLLAVSSVGIVVLGSAFERLSPLLAFPLALMYLTAGAWASTAAWALHAGSVAGMPQSLRLGTRLTMFRRTRHRIRVDERGDDDDWDDRDDRDDDGDGDDFDDDDAIAGADEGKLNDDEKQDLLAGSDRTSSPTWSGQARLLRRDISVVHKAVLTTIRRHRLRVLVLSMIAFTLTLILVASTYDLCVTLEPREYSSAMSRAFLPPSCLPTAAPCHVYLTVPEDLRTQIMVNFHVADSSDAAVADHQGWVVADTQPRQRLADYALAVSASAVTGHDNVLKYEVPRTVWYAALTGLAPNTTIYFRAGTGTRNKDAWQESFFSVEQHFRTASDNDTVRFVTGGDVGNSDMVPVMHRLAASLDPIAVAIGGDLAYGNGFRSCYRRWDTFLHTWNREMVAPGSRMIPMLFAIGNHESGGMDKSPKDTPFYLAYFPHSTDASPEAQTRPSYHAHIISNSTAILALDTAQLAPHAGKQLDWLKQQLGELRHRRVAFPIPLYHMPLYPSVWSHYTSDYLEVGQTAWLPVFDAFRLPVVFENHGHYYKRTRPLAQGKAMPDGQGTVYVGDGAYGVTSAERDPPQQHDWYLVRSGSTRYLVEVDVESSNKLSMRMLTSDGSLVDQADVPAR